MAENYDERPLRFCDSCGQVDRAPRHGLVTAVDDGKSNDELLRKALEGASPEEAVAVLAAAQDTAVLYKHIDCCASEGCQVCTETLDSAGDRRNADLAEYLAPKEA